jgi:hypothetical protein
VAPVINVTKDQTLRPRAAAWWRLPAATNIVIEFPATVAKLKSLKARYRGTALNISQPP